MPQAGDPYLVLQIPDGREERRWKCPRLAIRIGESAELAVHPDQGARGERPQPQRSIVEEPSSLRISRKQHLEAAVEQEAVHLVGADATPRSVRRLQDGQ